MADALILGGGFGGLAAATRLRDLLPDDAEIILVDREEGFYMGFAKLWELAGIRSIREGTRSLHDLQGRGVTFVQADVVDLDPASRTVATEQGSMQADTLLIALGAMPAVRHRQLLTGPASHDLYDGSRMEAIRADVEGLESGRVVIAVLGGPHQCPPAPFEAALIVDVLLRERGARGDVEIILTHPKPKPLPVAGPDASAYVARHLDERDIAYRGEHVVAGVEPGRVDYRNGEELTYELLLGVPAGVAAAVLRDTDLLGESGFVEPDRHTLRTGFERVYAVGDCTSIPTATGALPMAGVFAAAEGEVAAANMAADLGVGDGARYDGHGFCFLELPGRQVAFVEGDFYADPPDVEISPATRERFERKQAYERERLRAWLG